MTKIVIYADCTLDGFYEQTLEYLYDKYHANPLTQDECSVSDAERISYYDSVGQSAARHAMNTRRASRAKRDLRADEFDTSMGDLPLGKTVF